MASLMSAAAEFAFLRDEHAKAAEKYRETHDIAWFILASEIFEMAMAIPVSQIAKAGGIREFFSARPGNRAPSQI